MHMLTVMLLSRQFIFGCYFLLHHCNAKKYSEHLSFSYRLHADVYCSKTREIKRNTSTLTVVFIYKIP